MKHLVQVHWSSKQASYLASLPTYSLLALEMEILSISQRQQAAGHDICAGLSSGLQKAYNTISLESRALISQASNHENHEATPM